MTSDAPSDGPQPPASPLDGVAGPAPAPNRGVSPQPTASRAIAEVLLCSGFPTQLAISGLLASAGFAPRSASGGLSAPFAFTVVMLDSVILLTLIWLLLRRQGLRPLDVLIGPRPVWREAALGLSLIPLILILVGALMLGLRAVAPWLHNVPDNPLTSLVSTRAGLIASIVVGIVAGGVREEVQRAFLLRRFQDSLGGRGVGLVVTSLAFGLGHTLQGWDAAIITAVLGGAWGLLTLARGGAVASIAGHAGFDAVQLLIAGSTMGRLE